MPLFSSFCNNSCCCCWQFHCLQKYNFCWQNFSVKARCNHFRFFEVKRLAHGTNFNLSKKCLQLLRTKCFFMRQFRFRQSTTNRYQSIPIYLSIGIDNQYQSITTRIFAIDWSSIININRLIDIDWYRLILIVIDYRFHRLDTPGIIECE